MDESELISTSQGGDVDAFKRLITRYEGRIFRLAHSVCSRLPSEAEDVYQETFLTAFKKIKDFRKSSNLGTWLYRIAANLCWLRFRKKKREPFVPLLDLPHDHGDGPGRAEFKDWSPTPEEFAKRKELKEAVAKALSGLSVEYRLAVVLRDIEGLSNEEAAKVLNLSVPAIKSRLHRGRMFLRDRLDEHFQETPET